MKTLDVFIVTFYSDLPTLGNVLKRLEDAVTSGDNLFCRVYVVDNSFGREDSYFEGLNELLLSRKLDIKVYSAKSNIGFAKANNLAFDISNHQSPEADYVMVLNPDAFLSLNSLNQALKKMVEHPEIGVLLPRFKSQSGEDLYLAKRYPNLWLLFLRGFAPVWLKNLFQKSIDSYDLKDQSPDQPHFEAVVGSGACFLMRKNIWTALGGFDPRFFLYFEDFDLIYRAGKIAKLVYEPSIEVVHLGGHTARKGTTHIKYFIKSAWQFFNKNGWSFY